MSLTLAAIIVFTLYYSPDNLKLFLHKYYLDNINVNYIILSVFLPLLVLITTKLITQVFINDLVFLTPISFNKLLIVMTALIAEELGWRGFLQENFNILFSDFLTPILIGILWALWHYHFFCLGTMSVPFLLFLFSCIADSYSYYWITKKSKGNILPVSIWHFVENLCLSVFLITPDYSSLMQYM